MSESTISRSSDSADKSRLKYKAVRDYGCTAFRFVLAADAAAFRASSGEGTNARGASCERGPYEAATGFR
eukprot:10598368-Alexandrium_andersonii.AAC.1